MRLNQEKIERMFNARGSMAGGGGGGSESIAGLASQVWTEENYVSKAFFNELFIIHKKTTTTVYDGDVVVSTTVDTSGVFSPNEVPSQTESTDAQTGYRTVVETEVDNIEAKKGLWTDYFLSALGLNSSGGGGGSDTLAGLLDVELDSPTANQVLTYYNGKWRNMSAPGVDMNAVWQALGDTTTTQQIAHSHLTTALNGYATQLWVGQQGFLTSADLSGYATQTWVTNNFSTPTTVATQMQNYAYISNGAIHIGNASLTPITSVSGTFWGNSWTNGGTVTGSLTGVVQIDMTGHLIMHSGSTGIYLNSDGTGIDWHNAAGEYVSSLIAFTSAQVQINQDLYIPSPKIVRIGDAVLVWDGDNNALKLRHASGANASVNFYATGGVSALGYSDSGGGGGGGDVTWDLLANNTDTRPIALSHLTGALAGYATTSQLAGYLPLTGGTLTGDIYVPHIHITNTDGSNEITFARGGYNYLRTETAGGTIGIITNGKEMTGNSVDVGIGDGWMAINNGTNGAGGYNLYVNGSINGTSVLYNGNHCIHSGNIGSQSVYYADLSGNASSATKLQTARTIWGQSFDGTADITISTYAKMPFVLFKNYDNDNTAGYIGRGATIRNDIQLTANEGNKLELGANGVDGIITIDTSLNVGIGTASPSYKLHVAGTFYASGNSSIGGTIQASSFIKTNGTSSQFLKADGSVDSNSYALLSYLSNYLPLSGGTLTGDITAPHVHISDTEGSDSLTFVRGNYSYIRAITTGGKIGFVTDGKETTGNSVDVGIGDGWMAINNGTNGAGGYNLYVNGSINGTSVLYNGNHCIHSGNIGSQSVYYADLSGNASSATKLQTARTIWGQSFDGTADITISTYAKMPFVLFKNYDNDNTAGYIGRGASIRNDIQLTANTGNKLELGANGVDGIMTIDTSSNVGIGTASPSYKLHVVGTFYASGNSSIGGTLGVTGAITATGGVIGNASSATKLQTARTIWGASFDGTANVENVAIENVFERLVFSREYWNYVCVPATNGNIAFNIGATGTANTKMCVVNNGNVGIGTTSPSYPLHVVGTAYTSGDFISDGNVTTTSIELNARGTLSGYGGFIDFHYNGSSADYTSRIVEDASGRLYLSATNGVRIGDAVLRWESGNNALRIESPTGGAVNLYTTGGLSALGISGAVDGTVNASLIPSTTGTYTLGDGSHRWKELYLADANGHSGMIFVDYDGINLDSANGGYFDGSRFLVNGRLAVGTDSDDQPNYDLYVAGNTYVDGSNAYFSGNVSVQSLTQRSDMRIKDVISDMTLKISTIAQAPLFRYKLKQGDGTIMVGSSAQYWDALLPEVIHRDAEGILGLDYGVTALASVIAVAKEVTEHERRIARLEAENAILRAQIEDLKAA